MIKNNIKRNYNKYIEITSSQLTRDLKGDIDNELF